MGNMINSMEQKLKNRIGLTNCKIAILEHK